MDEVTLFIDIGTDDEPIVLAVNHIIAVYSHRYAPTTNAGYLVSDPLGGLGSVIVTPYGLLPSPLTPDEIVQEMISMFDDAPSMN